MYRFVLPVAVSLAAVAAVAQAPAAQEDPYLWLEEIEGERALAKVKEWNADHRGSSGWTRICLIR